MVCVKKFGLEVSPGTVYHQIHRFEENGIVKGARDVAGKTVYELTDKGMKLVQEFKEHFREPIHYICQHIVD